MRETAATLEPQPIPAAVVRSTSPGGIGRSLLTWALALVLCVVVGLALAELMSWLLAPGWSAAASFGR